MLALYISPELRQKSMRGLCLAVRGFDSPLSSFHWVELEDMQKGKNDCTIPRPNVSQEYIQVDAARIHSLS